MVHLVAVWLDYSDALHADLAEAALRNGSEFVQTYLSEGGVGNCGFLTPAPDLEGVDVVEIWAASQLAFFEKCVNTRIGRKVNQNARVAVTQSRNQGSARIFVQA